MTEMKAGPLYNGQPPYGFRGYLGDLTQRMMGYAIVRQVRIKKNSCKVSHLLAPLTMECSEKANLINEDTEDYCNAWEERTKLTEDLPSCTMPEFLYKSAAELGKIRHDNLISVYWFPLYGIIKKIKTKQLLPKNKF